MPGEGGPEPCSLRPNQAIHALMKWHFIFGQFAGMRNIAFDGRRDKSDAGYRLDNQSNKNRRVTKHVGSFVIGGRERALGYGD